MSDVFPSMPGDVLDQFIAALITAGVPHRAELYRAVRRGEIAIVEPDRSGLISMRLLKQAPRPVLVLIGDDDGASTGPDDWACLPQLCGWARRAIVHATGADIPSYQLAVKMAVVCSRGVLIESSSGMAPAWCTALRGARSAISTLVLLPTDRAHPTTPPRSSMQ